MAVLLVTLGAAAFLFLGATVSNTTGVFWVFGLAFGVILQRSRLCFASAFRDLFLMKDGRTMKAVLLGLALATAGFTLLMQRFAPDPTQGLLPPGAHVTPAGLNLLVGGLLFGLGMVLAGGCVSGTLYRVGEGYVGSMVSLAGILGGLVVASHTWNWWWRLHISGQPATWLPQWLGYGGALAATVAALLALYLLVLWWESRGSTGPRLSTPPQFQETAFAFSQQLRLIWRTVFVRGWPVVVGAAALGVLNILAYVYQHPLGVTGELSAWGNRITGLVGLTPPPLLGVDQLEGCNLVADEPGFFTNGFFLDGGLIYGSFMAALLAGEFKIRYPRQAIRYVQSLAGGSLMGYGAGIGIGCTIGAFFSAIPSLGLNGWIFGLGLLGGARAGVTLLRRIA